MPKKYSFIQTHENTTKLKIFDLSELDSSSYWCKAGFLLGESKGKVSLKVLTYLTPLKPFLVIAAEVIVLVALIFIYEVFSKKKEANTGKIWRNNIFKYASFIWYFLCDKNRGWHEW